MSAPLDTDPAGLSPGSRPPPPPLAAFRTQSSPIDGVRLGDRYRIVGQLDSGSTSTVYLAEDLAEGVPVVVKMLLVQAASDPQQRQRFVAGARTTMAVVHPAVARVFSVEEPPGELPYVVMEPLLGEPILSFLERRGLMPEGMVLVLARQIADGLSAAHAAGIVHRDLKPGNLFLAGDPDIVPRCKIIDFGFAKDTRARTDDEPGPSSRNLIVGTAQYMAPEQVLADLVDARADVYGFGATLFRLLTGHLPFDLDPGVDLFSHQIFSPTPPPSWLVEAIDPGLEQIVLRCMRKHPENRYPSMQAVSDDLVRIVNGLTISELPLQRDPDVYKPHHQHGLEAAGVLAERFGTDAPPPATVRWDPKGQT